MSLVLDWKKKLGYRKDPFERAVLLPASRFLVGLEEQKEQLNLFIIKDKRYGTLTGDTGSGKTLFLTWAEEMLKRGYSPHYVDAAKTPKQVRLLDALLSENISFLSRKFGKTLERPAEQKYQLLLKKLSSKKHILLVDNASSLQPDSQALLKDIQDKTDVIIIIADVSVKGVSIGKDDLGMKLPAYKQNELVEMLRIRIEDAGSIGTFPFTDEHLKEMIKQADKNPAVLLDIAREKAIELSLKVKNLPSREVTQKSQPQEERGSRIKKIGFLNIKINGPQEQEEPAPFIEEIPKSQEKDAAMLSSVVAGRGEPTQEDVEEILISEDASDEEVVIEELSKRDEHADHAKFDEMIKELTLPGKKSEKKSERKPKKSVTKSKKKK